MLLMPWFNSSQRMLRQKWALCCMLILGVCLIPVSSAAETVRVSNTDDLIKHLRQGVQAQYQIPAHNVLILWNDQSLESKLAEMGPGLSVELSEQELKNLINRPSLLLKVMGGSQYKGRIPLRIQVDGWLDVYQSECPLRQDQALKPQCLSVQRTKLSALPPQYVRSPFRIEDFVARQEIPAKTLLRPTMLKEKPLVDRGSTVKVVVMNGNLRLMAQGEALETGVRNDMIRVKVMSFQSEKIIRARISDEGEVTLEIGT